MTIASWIPLTIDDLSLVLAAREMTLLTAPDNTDYVTEMIADVVAMVREAIANNPANALPAGDIIPRTLRAAAVDILALRLLKRYALAVTDDRRKAAETAQARLDAIARAEIRVINESGIVDVPAWMEPAIISPDPAYGNDGTGFYPTPSRR